MMDYEVEQALDADMNNYGGDESLYVQVMLIKKQLYSSGTFEPEQMKPRVVLFHDLVEHITEHIMKNQLGPFVQAALDHLAGDAIALAAQKAVDDNPEAFVTVAKEVATAAVKASKYGD